MSIVDSLLQKLGIVSELELDILKYKDFTIILNSQPYDKVLSTVIPPLAIPTDYLFLPRPSNYQWSLECYCEVTQPFKNDDDPMTLEAAQGIGQFPMPRQSQENRKLNLSFVVTKESFHSKANTVESFLKNNVFEKNPKTFEIWFIKNGKTFSRYPYFKIESVNINKSPFNNLNFDRAYSLDITFKQSFALNSTTVQYLGEF